MIKEYLMGHFYNRDNIKIIKNDKELEDILKKYNGLSAMKIELIENKFIYTKYYPNMQNLDRCENFFKYIENIINNSNMKFNTPKYILMTHCNAITYSDCKYPIISSSRPINNDKIILWSQLFKIEIHSELNKYLELKKNDLPWEKKKNIFYFRGINSGTPYPSLRSYCKNRLSRYDLIKESVLLNSEYTDIYFNMIHEQKTLEKEINNLNFLENKFKHRLLPNKSIYDLQKEIKFALENTKVMVPMIEIFQNKFLICPEGHDCSTSLNWVLVSNCLAIVPPFHFENVIINSKQLKPYVHFVPIKEDFSNLNDIINWCLKNDNKCQEIVKNANNYMKNLSNKKYMYEIQKNIIYDLIK